MHAGGYLKILIKYLHTKRSNIHTEPLDSELAGQVLVPLSSELLSLTKKPARID